MGIAGLEKVYKEYKGRTSSGIERKRKLEALHQRLINIRLTALMDAASSAAALGGIIYGDRIRYGAIDETARKAFFQAFPGQKLEMLETVDPEQVQGIVSNWKGKYFEMLVVDKLNKGELVGELRLAEGQSAVLADALNQPGWDLSIIDENENIIQQIQLKATDSIGYIRDTIVRYPDIDIITTDNFSPEQIDDLERVFNSGMTNESVEKAIYKPMAAVDDSPLEEFVEDILPFLPFIIIAAGEGLMYLMKKKTLDNAIKDGAFRCLKTGVSMAAGGICLSLGFGFLALPVAITTRLMIDGKRRVSRVHKDTAIRLEQLRSI